jgi:hypothetical protein
MEENSHKSKTAVFERAKNDGNRQDLNKTVKFGDF